jgi:hypothetical protein
MSFGFGVGDFVAVINLAREVRKGFAGAPEQFQQISAEYAQLNPSPDPLHLMKILYRVRNLTIVLDDVDVSLTEHDVTKAQESRLGDIRKSCRFVLEDTQKELSKYSSLESRNGSLGQQAKRVWKRLRWEPDEIRDLRIRMVSNITALNSFRLSYTSDNVTKLRESSDQQYYEKILNWLTPTDFAAQHTDAVRGRQAGTGQWLIDSPEFTKWTATKGEVLFCHGIPGAGKTILASIVVETLQTTYNKNDIAVCYFYCNFQRQEEQRLENVILSLIKQLAQAANPFPDCLKELYDRHKAKGNRPSLEEATRILHSLARSFTRLFVVVDALDECQTSDGSQRNLITELIELKRIADANVLATSRPVPYIVESFQSFVSLEIRAHEEDMKTYINGNIQHLPRFVDRNPELLEEIITGITKAADGMYVSSINLSTKLIRVGSCSQNFISTLFWERGHLERSGGP